MLCDDSLALFNLKWSASYPATDELTSQVNAHSSTMCTWEFPLSVGSPYRFICGVSDGLGITGLGAIAAAAVPPVSFSFVIHSTCLHLPLKTIREIKKKGNSCTWLQRGINSLHPELI